MTKEKGNERNKMGKRPLIGINEACKEAQKDKNRWTKRDGVNEVEGRN